MSRARELAKVGGKNQQIIAGLSSHVGVSTFKDNVFMYSNLEVTGTTAFNGGTLTLGDSASDNVVFGADVNSNIIPNTDNAYDLGSSSQEWKDLYIDGTANIDSLVADTADINGGTVDGATVGANSASSGAFTTLSASGNVDLGDATSDTITATGRFDSDLVPSTDNARDLGTSSLEWKDLYLDGTANIDALVADTAIISDLTSGRVVLAGTSGEIEDSGNLTFSGNTLSTVHLSTTGNVDLGNGTDDTITATGRFDSDLVPSTDGTRDLGSSTLEWQDLYIDGTANIDSLVADTADINGGTADNVVIGGSTAAAGSFTTVAASSNATITGNLDVDGDTTLDTTDIAGTLTVAGQANVDNVIINGSTITTSADNLTLDSDGSSGGTVAIADNATVAGNLTVTGTTTLSTALANSNLANSAVTVTAGDGLTGGGSISLGGSATLNVQVDDSSIETDSDTLRVKASGVTNAMLAGSITNAKLAGSIANGKLSNSSVSYGGISLSLGGTDATPAFNLADATGLPISSGVSGLAANVATFLGTPSSANLRSALTDETGTGAAVFAASPTLTGTVVAANLDISGDVDIDGTTNLDVVDIDGSLDVDGHLNADNVSIAGVSTFTGATTFTGAIDANGGATVDNIQIGITNDNEIDTSSGNLVIDSAGGTTTVDDNLTVSGNLTVNGTTTTINSTTVAIDDKNFQVATGAADDAAADGAGLTVDSGDGDKTWNFEATGDNWGASENINIASGKSYKINNSSVLNATTLGSSVVASSLTSVGTIASGTWNGTAIANGYLANSSVSYGGVSLSLGGSDGTPAFDLSDATNYPTSSLSGTITNAQLAGSITNAKLAGSIADSKLSTISTANKVSLSALNIDGGTDIGAALVGTDEIIVDDGGGGTNRRSDMSRVKTYIWSSASGDATASDSGAITLAASGVSAGTVGSSSAIPILTIDAKGRITSTSTSSIDSTAISQGNSSMTVSDSGTGSIVAAIDGSTLATFAAAGITLSSGAFVGNVTGNVTGNTSGSSGSCTGNAATATILANARTIAGVSFNGSANISLNNNAITNGAGYITSSGTSAACSGNSATATLASSSTISANNSTNETVYPVFVDGATGTQGLESDTGFTYNPSSGTLTSSVFVGALTGNVTGNTSGSSGSCSGNAATATKLATSRTIAGVSFDGSANISLNNNAITNGAGYVTSSGWTSSNDGSGSGLDADLLDGVQGSAYLRSNTSDTFSGTLTMSGNIIPNANGTRDLGASGTRWANVYSSDLDLSNEAKGGNQVDGSWGSYLIEEGENDLFLKNRRTGKQYKFVLQEV